MVRMYRILSLVFFSATAAQAWDFTPGLPCLLTHETPDVQVTLTHDPTLPLYTLTLTQTAPWPRAAVFSMSFSGAAALSIATDRHQLSPDGTALTVTDRGFGNVLNGLQFNDLATAQLGARRIGIPLAGAAEPVAQFRRCEARAGV